MNLKQMLRSINMELNDFQYQRLQQYIDLLLKWNKTYNLVATQDRNEIEIKHVLDSLSVAPYILEKNILDVGTGAGFPGIPLAIIEPEKLFTLLDSNGKKTRFLTQVAFDLKLQNITIKNQRIEAFQSEHKFDAIICRALTSIPEFIQQTKHLIQSDGRWYAMKGKIPEQELAQLHEHFTINTHKLEIPELDAERHIIILKGK